jgi:hypothetical protein
MKFHNKIHLTFVYSTTRFLHITVHISQKIMAHNFKNVINDNLCFLFNYYSEGY